MDTPVENNRESSVLKLKDLIADIKVAMMTTHDGTGAFHSRPMWVQEIEPQGVLWFFTANHSAKAREILKNNQVVLNYSEPRDNRYIAVVGRVQVVEDRARCERLWNPLYHAWFPKGLDDPELALLRVEIDRAEYWDSPSSQVVQLLGFAKSIVTGQRYEPGPGEHQKLNLAG